VSGAFDFWMTTRADEGRLVSTIMTVAQWIQRRAGGDLSFWFGGRELALISERKLAESNLQQKCETHREFSFCVNASWPEHNRIQSWIFRIAYEPTPLLETSIGWSSFSFVSDEFRRAYARAALDAKIAGDATIAFPDGTISELK
jgi:hypothetical protein